VYKSKGNEWHNNYNKYSQQDINKNAGLGTAKVARKQKKKFWERKATKGNFLAT
jgi:hypothetical protein